jgi:hypothetical protein
MGAKLVQECNNGNEYPGSLREAGVIFYLSVDTFAEGKRADDAIH